MKTPIMAPTGPSSMPTAPPMIFPLHFILVMVAALTTAPAMIDHTSSAETPLFQTELPGLTPLHRGKVRDLYAVDAGHMLIVTTDRLSAFDVVLPDPIPGKGRVLNEISMFWFARTGHIVPNHLSALSVASVVSDPQQRALLEGRAVVVRRLR